MTRCSAASKGSARLSQPYTYVRCASTTELTLDHLIVLLRSKAVWLITVQRYLLAEVCTVSAAAPWEISVR